MSRPQHLSDRRCKAHSADAPYCRPADWWKSSDYKSEKESFSSKHERQRKRRHRPIRKEWSIVILRRPAGKKSASPELEREFGGLVKQWKKETFALSSLSKIYAHPGYQRIMAMGKEGIPLVLKELQKNQGHWFYALRFMAGEQGKGVAEGLTDFESAKAAWLEWGYQNNHL